VSALLELSELEVCYGEARALNGVTLDVPRNSLVTVIGSNGAGKTSLIRTIAGMLKPSSGQIRFEGVDIGGWDSNRACELGIGQVAEGRQIFASLTVEENLILGGSLKRAQARRSQNLQRAYDMFPRLAERRRQKAGTLSGGEQQMLAIGRCLMAEPKLILFDEPSLGLSPVAVELVFATIRDLRAAGVTVLLVEQNVADSLELADFAAVLENGAIVLSGPATDLARNERVKSAYLGI
jgi:branched-chain amino acid transport system ATP-binding protein